MRVGIDRGRDESKIQIQKVNNGLWEDLVRIAKENGQLLPTFLKPYLRKIRDENAHLLNKPRFD